ncbi:MAG: M23 family metallopeptidase [Ruminococcaceae bacterium]|nr:M23 family metallopeptidase [Oscillospiraceae bacterium]
MKTNYNKKKTTGIYAAVLLSLAAILSLTYLSTRSVFNRIDDDKADKIASSNAQQQELENNENSNSVVPTVKPKDDVTQSSSSSQNSSQESSSSNTASETTKETVGYIMPVNGDISAVFSTTTPVFSKTMEDWRIHTGIDIKGNLGDSVKACAAGTVEDIYTDELKGVTVVLSHADGIKSLYCGLDKSVNVEIGEKIKSGKVIGKIGNTNELEALEEPHLHFEMVKNGVQLDPLNIIK